MEADEPAGTTTPAVLQRCGARGSPDTPLTADHLKWPAYSLADVEVTCRGGATPVEADDGRWIG
jgi:hypothetical protein